MNHVKKSALMCMIYILFILNTAGAYTGLMAGEKSVKYISTVWFDIIYSPSSRQYAYDLSQKADSIYKEICDSYGITPDRRYPVAIVTNMQVYNAYFSNALYNHIVLFDTAPDEDLSLSYETNINTFRHELNHAVIANMTKGFYKELQSIFFDAASYASMTITRTITEGSSVAMESHNNQGRLNDGFYMHTVKQMKLNGNFPSWQDSMGNNDTGIEGGCAYSIGGPFTDYLQKTYGMDKYALFISSCVNASHLSMSMCFKSVYNKSLDTVWSDFYQSIQVPDIKKDPLKEDFVYDFFNITKGKDPKTLSSENRRGSFYDLLAQSKDSFIYKCANTVYISQTDKDKKSKKAKALFNKKYIYDLSISTDGRYICTSNYDLNHQAMHTGLSIYDTVTGQWFNVKEESIKNGVIIYRDSKYYLAAVKYKNTDIALNYYLLDLDNTGRINGMELKDSLQFVSDSYIYSLVPYGVHNQKLALIYQSNLMYHIRIYDRRDFTEYNLPQEFRIRDLCYDCNTERLVFSYVKDNSFPRLGIFTENKEGKGIFSFMQQDVSGGVYSPVMTGDRVIYKGIFVNDYKLLQLDINKMSFTVMETQGHHSIHEYTGEKEDYFIPLNEKDYRIKDYATLIPLLSAGTATMNLDTYSTMPVVYGASYMLQSPWSTGYTGISIGRHPFYNLYLAGIGINYDSTSWNGNTYYNQIISSVFDQDGLYQVNNYINTYTVFHIGNISSIILSDSSTFFYGKQITSSLLSGEESDTTVYYYGFNSLGLSLNYIISGDLYKNKLGCTIGAYYKASILGSNGNVSADNYYSLAEGSVIPFTFYHNIVPYLSIYLPKLLPFDCVKGLSYNLPVSFNLYMTPSSYNLMKGDAEVILFKMDIQKGLKGFIPLYLYRIVITADYDFYIYSKNSSFRIKDVITDFKDISKEDYADSISINIALVLGSYMGSLASSSIQISPYAGLTYSNMETNKSSHPLSSRKFSLSLGISSSL